MAMTFTETLGFIETLIQYLTANQATLAGKGLTVETWVPQLQTLKGAMVARNEEQEAIKAQLRSKTNEVEAAEDAAYRQASTWLDTVVAVLGKTSEEGKQAAKMRSDVRRGGGGGGTTAGE